MSDARPRNHGPSDIEAAAERRALLAIYPDRDAALTMGQRAASHTDWEVHQVSGTAAVRCLEIGDTLRNVNPHRITEADTRLRRELWSLLPYSEASDVPDRLQVFAPDLVPIDLALDDRGLSIGDSHIVSHLMASHELVSRETLHRMLKPTRHLLSSYVLICPMAMDRELHRHLQDIIVVATSLENELPVEVWLQPRLDRALNLVESPDVGILHIDTHGDSDGGRIMLGPSRSGGMYIAAAELPTSVGAALVVAVGCSLTASADGVGMGLLERGAISVLGPCVQFLSLGLTGSEEGEAMWYRALFEALIGGADVGNALRRARSAVGDRALKNTWILLGSSLLSFRPESASQAPTSYNSARLGSDEPVADTT